MLAVYYGNDKGLDMDESATDGLLFFLIIIIIIIIILFYFIFFV